MLHTAVVFVHFVPPMPAVGKDLESSLEVVLVNARSKSRPAKAEVVAQVDLDGGGDTDQKLRAKSPLPPKKVEVPSEELETETSKVAQLEAQQRVMEEQLRVSTSLHRIPPKVQQDEPKTAPPAQEIDTEAIKERAREIQSLEAQISRSLQQYQQRPRRGFYGASAQGVVYAQYVEDWRAKVERIGNLNYPAEASRDRIYGTLRLTVEINHNGELINVEISRSSGHRILDEAAQRIVRLGAPYQSFSPEMRKSFDTFVIVRTWKFEKNSALAFGD